MLLFAFFLNCGLTTRMKPRFKLQTILPYYEKTFVRAFFLFVFFLNVCLLLLLFLSFPSFLFSVNVNGPFGELCIRYLAHKSVCHKAVKFLREEDSNTMEYWHHIVTGFFFIIWKFLRLCLGLLLLTSFKQNTR